MIAASDGGAMLAGVKVVDLTGIVFGPYATQILADLGAEVIKIESPAGGDPFRWSGKGAATPGMSPGFLALNRGKQSLALDLKRPDDLTAMKALLADADLFVLNVRGKAAERLGLDYESVRALNPAIVYLHCVGFGQDGPYADLQAYDDVIQAASGAATLAGRVDGDPRPRYIPSLIADKVAGLHAGYAALAALIHKLRTGRGQRVEVPMFEAFTHFMLLEHLGGLTFDPPTGPVCYGRQIDPDRQPFPTRDGHVGIVPYTDESWARLFAVLGNAAFLDDPRFDTRALRAANLPALYRELARLTRGFDTADLVARLQAEQIPAQAVRDIGDILDEPHLAATGFFERLTHPSEGAYVATRPPVRFADAPVVPRRHPPRLGEHD